MNAHAKPARSRTCFGSVAWPLDTNRKPLSVGSDAERALPDARGQVTGRTKREGQR
jgi:hypothetical protein